MEHFDFNTMCEACMTISFLLLFFVSARLAALMAASTFVAWGVSSLAGPGAGAITLGVGVAGTALFGVRDKGKSKGDA